MKYAFTLSWVEVIEVHFTDKDKNRKFRDHSLSFTKNDLRTLKNKIEDNLNLLEILKKIQKSERSNRKLIRKGIVAAKNLKPESIIKKSDLKYARPAIILVLKNLKTF